MGWGGGGEWRKGTTLTYMNLYMSFRAKWLALSHSLSPPFSPRNYQTTGNTLCRPLVHINSTIYNLYVSCFHSHLVHTPITIMHHKFYHPS